MCLKNTREYLSITLVFHENRCTRRFVLKRESYFRISQSPFPRPMAHRAVPISVSMALGHASASAVKAAAGGGSTGSSASLTFPLHSHMSSARREGSEYHFKKVFGMSRPGFELSTYRL